MTQLQHLNLSWTLLSGEVPQNLGNLTNLVALDLGGSCNPSLMENSIEWVFKLENLQYLDLSGIDLSQALDALDLLRKRSSLSVLKLACCGLGNHHLVTRNSNLSSSIVEHLNLRLNHFSGPFPYFIQNLTSLKFLDLSGNDYLNSSIPSWLGNKRDLGYLSLWDNEFSGPFPYSLQNMTYLEHLYLGGNYFTGSFPQFIQNLSFLVSLDLSGNQFSSSIPSWLANKRYIKSLHLSFNQFSHVEGGIMNIINRFCSLKYLDLSYNQLEEEVSEPYSNFSRCSQYNLEGLWLSNNNMSGQLPTMRSLLSLQELDLSHNNFEVIPASFGELSSMERAYLSHNRLSVVQQGNLANLSSLRNLDISSNSLTLDLSPDWLPPFQLVSLRILPCNLSSSFPMWLLSQENISELDLSGTGIFGPLPSNIGYAMPSLQSLKLANNDINGSIPTSLCDLANLEVLELQNNTLSGMIPDCWDNSQQIVGVELSSNRLSGPIPISLTKVETLELLSLSNNPLEGELPLSLHTCRNLMVVDVGKNNLQGKIPDWNGTSVPSLQILILRENRFKGIIPPQLCSVHTLQIMDLASNHLVGTIPPCFGHFKGMGFIQHPGGFIALTPSPNASTPSPPAPAPVVVSPDEWSAMEVTKGVEREYTKNLHLLVNMDLSCNELVGVIPTAITNLSRLFGLNLSHNHLTGAIPMEIGKMKSLESLDLSSNNLSGSIPESISSLDSLSNMNLAFNNLQGRIPTGRHLQTLEDPSMYMGNPGLCGDPLPEKCFGDEAAHPPTSMVLDEEEDNKHEKMWFYLIIMSGFVIGFWGVIGLLVVHKKWRHAYFRLAEDLADWIYVRFALSIARANGER